MLYYWRQESYERKVREWHSWWAVGEVNIWNNRRYCCRIKLDNKKACWLHKMVSEFFSSRTESQLWIYIGGDMQGHISAPVLVLLPPLSQLYPIMESNESNLLSFEMWLLLWNNVLSSVMRMLAHNFIHRVTTILKWRQDNLLFIGMIQWALWIETMWLQKWWPCHDSYWFSE